MKTGRQFLDQEVVQNIERKQNFDETIGFLYDSLYKKVQAFIVQNNGSPEDAQDIFQEVMVAFIEVVTLKKFRGDSSVATFLLALARNMWYNELKKRARSKIREMKYEGTNSIIDKDLDGYIASREYRKEVIDLVSALGETCKKILTAFYFDNLSMSEILRFLDYENEQVVRNKKYKCLKQLGQTIAKRPGLADNLKSIFFYE